MNFATGIVVYAMIWVVMLFLVLPWGVRLPERIGSGHATSAPENPYIGLKLLVTSILSALLWVVAYLILRT